MEIHVICEIVDCKKLSDFSMIISRKDMDFWAPTEDHLKEVNENRASSDYAKCWRFIKYIKQIQA